MTSNDLSYALAKQVPDMGRGFTVQTAYGDILVPPGVMADTLRGQLQRAMARQLAKQRAAECRQQRTASMGQPS